MIISYLTYVNKNNYYLSLMNWNVINVLKISTFLFIKMCYCKSHPQHSAVVT